jgi:RNA polymerase sigma factor for flagellar operon FliA
VPDPEVSARVSELVAGMMPQARVEAYKVWQRAPHALELDELHAIALKGLAEAAARWQVYCAEKGHDPRAFEYFPAYVLARMRGAMLDNLRSQDWVTRSDRTRAKAIRDAGQDRGASEAELARATVPEVRSTLAAVSARPVSIDAEPHDVADEADVESQAVVSEVLAAVSAVTSSLPPDVQVMLALRYYAGRTIADAAAAVGMEPGEAGRAHTRAILSIHDAMIKAVA